MIEHFILLQELEESAIQEKIVENIVQESVGEAIEIESDGDKEEIDAVEEIKDHEDTPKSTIVEIADTESCRDDILSNVSEKGIDILNVLNDIQKLGKQSRSDF